MRKIHQGQSKKQGEGYLEFRDLLSFTLTLQAQIVSLQPNKNNHKKILKKSKMNIMMKRTKNKARKNN